VHQLSHLFFDLDANIPACWMISAALEIQACAWGGIRKLETISIRNRFCLFLYSTARTIFLTNKLSLCMPFFRGSSLCAGKLAA